MNLKTENQLPPSPSLLKRGSEGALRVKGVRGGVNSTFRILHSAIGRFPHLPIHLFAGLMFFALLTAALPAWAAPGDITTIAGGSVGDAGSALSAPVGSRGVAVDSFGNIFIADYWNHRIRKVDTSGIITTVAGNGTQGYSGDGGAATLASLKYPSGVAVDSSGNIYIADTNNYRVRKVDTSGIITTVAGSGTYGYSGDGGAATSASLSNFAGVAVDSSGNMYIADWGNYCIRKVDTSGIITTVAGNGTQGYSGDGSVATSASLNDPVGVAVDSSGNIYIADSGNNRVRKVDTSDIITTVAGSGSADYSGDGGAATSASLYHPVSVSVDSSGNMYIADWANERIRKVDTSGIITTVAGNGTSAYSGDGGSATSASLYYPSGVAVDSSGNIYIADSNNNRVRKVNTSGVISTIAGNGTQGFSGDGGVATSASLNGPRAVAVDSSGNIYVADTLNGRIRKVGASGMIGTIAGNGRGVYSGDGGAAISVNLNDPSSVAVDSSGNIYFVETNNGRIRKVDPSGVISTVAGNGGQGFSGDGGPATSASLYLPTGVAVDSSGSIYIADFFNHRIRKVNTTGVISTIAGNGTQGFSGDGGVATSASLNGPAAVAVDLSGNIYIADIYNYRIRKIDTSGVISTVAGNGTYGYSGDNGAATSASLSYPYGIAIDVFGNIYLAEPNNRRIRKVDISGIITTIAGNGTATYSGDGGAATLAGLNNPYGVAVDSSGNIYIADYGNHRIRKVEGAGDTTPPTGTISINSGAAYTNSTNATLILSCTDSSGCSQMQFSNDNSSWSTPETYGTSKTGWTLSSGDGTKTVYVKFKDTAGNWSTATISDTIILDSTAPTTTASPAGRTYASAQSVTLTCSDGTGSGCDKIYYTTDGSTPTTSSSIYSTPITISISASTTLIKFFAKDLVGNSETFKTETYTFATNVIIGGSIQGTPLNLTSSNAAVTTLAGSAGLTGSTDGTGSAARLHYPDKMATDGVNLFVADRNNNTIRKIVISTGAVTTLAGSAGSSGSTDGTGSSARFNQPYGVTTDGTNLFVADTDNHTIRKIVISTGAVTTLAGSAGLTGSTDGTGSAARFNRPVSITTDGTNLFVTDSNDHTIRKIVISTGAVTTVAGSAGITGSTDGTGSVARFQFPQGITTDGINLFVTDSSNCTIRKIVISTSAVTTIAGSPGFSGSTDGTGSSARFYGPIGITTDGTNLFVADTANHTIRKISVVSDTTAPTGTISINSGAASTNSTSVTLTLTCTDTGTGCSQMKFSNDNSSWSTPETYGTPKTWTLSSGDGTKTVYVKFKDTAGNWSTAYNDTITLDTPPSKPANIDVSQNGVKGELLISWSNPSVADFNHIHIYRSTASGTLGTLIADNLTGIKYTDTSLASLTTYYYTVRAVDTAGQESTNTNTDKNEYGYYPKATTLDATPPAAPTNVTATNATTGGKINLSWTKPTDSDLSMIKVYRSTASGTLGSSVFIGLATSYSDTGLTNGTAYYYTVRAIDTSSNETTNTTQVSATPTAPDTTAPAVPTTGGTPVVNTTAGGTLTISWTNPVDGDFAFVRIYRSTTSGVLGTLVYDNVTGTTKTDTGLTNNATYYYTIRSVDSSGNESTNTNQISGTPSDVQAPKQVTDLKATLLAGGQIKLDWVRSSSTDINYYNIYSDNGTGTINYVTRAGRVAHPAATWTSGSLTVGTAYKFAVRAEDLAQNEEANTGIVISAVPVTDPNAGDVKGYITTPQIGYRISGSRVTVAADLVIGNRTAVKEIRFQYKPVSSGTWTDITTADAGFPNPDTTYQWLIYWDVTSLANGDYNIRGVATNVNLSIDTAPAYTTVTVDNTTPQATETIVGGVPVKRQEVSSTSTSNVAVSDSTGVTELTIPESALSSDTKVNVTITDPATKDSLVPSGYGKANEFREITLDSGQTALSNDMAAEISIPYQDDDNDDIIDGTSTKIYDLKVMRYNAGTGKWEKLDSVVDKVKKRVKGKTNHFTLFGLLAPPNPTTPGWNIVAVPLNPSPNSALTVFGQTPYVYNPTTNAYDRPSTIQPGIGYWIKGGANLTATGTETSTAGNFSITIKKGWNMIGNPFRFNVKLSDCKVLYSAVEYTMAQAETNGYLIGTVYPYINGVYQFINASDGGKLEPWVGYWILSDKDMTLLVPPIPAQ